MAQPPVHHAATDKLHLLFMSAIGVQHPSSASWGICQPAVHMEWGQQASSTTPMEKSLRFSLRARRLAWGKAHKVPARACSGQSS